MKVVKLLNFERKIREKRINNNAKKLHDALKDFEILYAQNYDACLYAYCRDKATLKQRELKLNFLVGTIIAFIIQTLLSFLASFVLKATTTSQIQALAIGSTIEVFDMLCFFGVSMFVVLLIIYLVALFFYKEDMIDFEIKTKRLEQLPKKDVQERTLYL